jgi:hypothetical protein
MRTNQKDYSFVIFPFLKTYAKVQIGNLIFRPTNDTEDLTHEQVVCLNEIADMLFLQDDYRIKSASYAVTSIDRQTNDIEHLKNVQAFVAYCYASPRHEFGDIFLSSEHASMVIFTPGNVPIFFVRPDFHVEAVQPISELVPDHRHEVPGYVGVYNFQHSFWAVKGSRVYGPTPRLTLNISQDLSRDLGHTWQTRTDYRLLSDLLRKPPTEMSSRIFTAVQWFNAANKEANDDAEEILNLSIAFEALLDLPVSEKTERFTDAISLLLGRTPRLDIWARQFYDARSQVVHEGRAQRLRFAATDSRKSGEGHLYQSLVSYGRRVFQLCLGILLAGAELAEEAGLAETLVTNEERFQKICRLLAGKNTSAIDRLEQIAPIVSVIEQYRYIQEDNLQIETMLSAVRHGAESLLESGETISQEVREHLETLIAAKRTNGHLERLDALQALDNIMENGTVATGMVGEKIVGHLVKLVWGYLFMHHHWLKKEAKAK